MNAFDRLKELVELGAPESSITIVCNELNRHVDRLFNHLMAYWTALSDIFEDAFRNPYDYTLQRSTGIYTFHRIFNSEDKNVYKLCTMINNFTVDAMEKFLRFMLNSARIEFEDWPIGPDEDMFWHKKRGHDLAKATSQKLIGQLAEKLRRHLPASP